MTTVTEPVFEDVDVPAYSNKPAEPPPRTQHDLPAGMEVPLIAPGSDEWYTTISASKIAAIAGLSPYDSPFSLWHKMKGTLAREEQTSAMMRGHYLEPAVAAWFRDQHPTWQIRPAGTFVAAWNSRYTCSPDRLVFHADIPDGERDLLQIKSTTKDHEWGQPGTDEVPDYYGVQVLWEMHTAGASRCHVGVIGTRLEFTEYVVDYDPAKAAELQAKAEQFLAMLDAGTPPDIDSHGATYNTLRELTPPATDDATVDIDESLARRYCNALAAAKTIDDEVTGAKSAMLAAIGDARYAYFDGNKIADRRPSRPGATPSLYAAKPLPTFATEAPAEPADADSDGDPEPAVDRTQWLIDRKDALKANNPEMVPAAIEAWRSTGIAFQPPWTDTEIDTLSTVLHGVEQQWPATDPAAPPPPPLTIGQEQTPPALPTIEADDALADADDVTGLKATIRGLAESDHKIAMLTHWAKQGRNGERPWDSTDGMTVRQWTIARAVVRFLVAVGADDQRLRMALAYILGDDLQTTWPTGAVLGTLTTAQANELAEISDAYRAKDTTVRAVIDAT